jgi:prophage regulatory protein
MTLVRFDALKDEGIPWSRVHLARLEKAGKFPKRVRLGGGIAWLKSDLDQFKAAAVAASRSPV